MKGVSSKFSSDFSIDVVVGSHKYDLTIVDLPGLIAYDSENHAHTDNEIFEIVKDYVKKYKNAIIFHVVECPAEPEKIQSLKFVVKIADSKTKIINIVTKSDLLPSGDNAFQQLLKKLRGDVFCVNGNTAAEKQLEGISRYGLHPLCSFLEGEIKRNVDLCYRALQSLLKTNAEALDRQLKDELREFNPQLELGRMIFKYKNEASVKLPAFKAAFQSIYKSLKEKVGSLKNISKLDGGFKNMTVSQAKSLKVGDVFYYRGEGEDRIEDSSTVSIEDVVRGVVTKITALTETKSGSFNYTLDTGKVDTLTIEKSYADTGLWGTYSNYQEIAIGLKSPETNSYYRYYIRDTVVALAKVQEILDSTGFLEHNMHKPLLPVIAHFASAFADQYQSAVKASENAIMARVQILFESIEHPGIRCIIDSLIINIQKEFARRLTSLVRKNKDSMMVTSTNDHYLTSIFQKLIEKAGSLSSDGSTALIASYHVIAYIKDQCKYVQQASCDLLNEFFYLNISRVVSLLDINNDFSTFESADDPVIYAPLQELIHVRIEIDEGRERMRQRTLEDRQCLEDCLSMMR